MKKSLLLCLAYLYVFSFSSCYVYKVKTYPEEEPLPLITDIIKKDQIFKLQVDDELRKVKIAGWEGDSLRLYPKLNSEENAYKVHKNQIQEVQHRMFSKIWSNGFSLIAYGVIALGVVLLL